MADDRRNQVREYMEEEYLPINIPGMMITNENKIANAAEYTAYHMGKISRALGRIAIALEKIAAKP